jgi:hypothetical protein
MRPAAGIHPSIVLAAAWLASAGVQAATPAAPAARATLPSRAAAPASAASAAAASAGVPLSDACPAQLPVTQTVSRPIAGWTPLNQDGNYPFVRVAFYPGPPADNSLIVPSIEFRKRAGLHDGWNLPHRADGYWMTCAYANTTATVARKLPDDVDFCQADYDGRFLTLVVRRWSCGIKRTMPPPVVAHPAAKPAKPVKPPYKRSE